MPRERKPLAQHALENTKPQYVTPDSPCEPGRPKYPRGISGEAKKAFKRLVKLLGSRRHLTDGDSEILRLYAVLFDRHVRALDAIAKEGEIRSYTRLNNRGEDVQCEKPNLWLKIAETCESRMLMCLSQLGLNPTARGKVVPTEIPKPATAEDALEQLLSREQPTTAPAEDDLLGDIDVDAPVN